MTWFANRRELKNWTLFIWSRWNKYRDKPRRGGGGANISISSAFQKSSLAWIPPWLVPFLDTTSATWMPHNHHLLTHINTQPVGLAWMGNSHFQGTALIWWVCNQTSLLPHIPGCVIQGAQPAPTRSHRRTQLGLLQTYSKSVCCNVHCKDFTFLGGKGISVYKNNTFTGLWYPWREVQEVFSIVLLKTIFNEM